MKTTGFIALLLATVFSAASAHAATIPTVPIGNPANPADTRYNIFGGFPGSVAYDYRIGMHEVTNAQYVEFLNAVGASDPFELYDTQMESDTRGGIVRSGSAGSYTYAVKPPALAQGPDGSDYLYDSKPVVFVSFLDAARFTNWLHNGQPAGAQDATTTEDGSYTFILQSSGAVIPDARNADARWFVPSQDEWHKAAYYDPNAGVYYDYPTGTNGTPNNNLPSADTGNSANFFDGNFTTGSGDYPMTDAGAYTISASPYGTLDQGGNVREWTEIGFFNQGSGVQFRGFRGGSWSDNSSELLASSWGLDPQTAGSAVNGFRVATIIPESSALLLLTFGFLPLLCRRFNPAARRG
jgi:formylglycine-generating enzyme required for sulfatase activity